MTFAQAESMLKYVVSKQRIDNILVSRGLVESREKARALVMAGDVLVGGRMVSKPGMLVGDDAEVTVQRGLEFVGRGGTKLAHALDEFSLDVNSLVAVDVGASTGGFTDCLLQRGARRVYAVDVGYGQLDYRLRQDPRVVVLERVNARYPFTLPETVDMATVDLSFISVEKVLPAVAALVKDGGWLIVLLKPPFEAGRREVGRGGVVKEPMVHAAVLGRFINWVIRNGFRLGGLTPSPILGAAGNREFFVLLRKPGETSGLPQGKIEPKVAT